jgi:hypothetical protein
VDLSTFLIRESVSGILIGFVAKRVLDYFRRDEARLREEEEWEAKLEQSGHQDLEEPWEE